MGRCLTHQMSQWVRKMCPQSCGECLPCPKPTDPGPECSAGEKSYCMLSQKLYRSVHRTFHRYERFYISNMCKDGTRDASQGTVSGELGSFFSLHFKVEKILTLNGISNVHFSDPGSICVLNQPPWSSDYLRVTCNRNMDCRQSG